MVLSLLEEVCGEVVGYPIKLQTIGSEALGTAVKGSDVDVICLIPVGLSKKEFLQAVQQELVGIYETAQLAIEANVPILRLVIEGMAIDLLVGQSRDFPINIAQITVADRHRFDKLSWKVISGYLEVNNLHQLTAPFIAKAQFQELVQLVIFWAKRRQLKGNAFGFLGTYSWTILVAWSCIQYGKQGTSKTVSEWLNLFFQHLAKYDWTKPIALTTDSQSYQVTLPQDQLPIITTVIPYFNSAKNVTNSTCKILKEELNRGKKITTQIAKSKATWQTLFAPIDFTNYNTIFQLTVKAEDPKDLDRALGWLKGHQLGLILAIEKTLSITIRPSTQLIEQSKQFTVNFYVKNEITEHRNSLLNLLATFETLFKQTFSTKVYLLSNLITR